MNQINTNALKDRFAPADVLGLLKVNYKRVGKRLATACPSCGKLDKFDVHVETGAHFCFVCESDASGGDVIGLVQTFQRCSFLEACEFLGGDRDISEDERQEIETRRRAAETKLADDQARKARADKAEMRSLISQAKPGFGSPVQTYLEARGLGPALLALGWVKVDGSQGAWPKDVCFLPALQAFAGKPGDRISLGRFPVMLMFGRRYLPEGTEIVLVHRTYLQINDDDTVTKAKPDLPEAYANQWNAKQIIGSMSACDAGVFLGSTPDITDNPLGVSIVGEGLETVLAVAAAAPEGQAVSGEYFAALSLNRLVGTSNVNAAGNRGFVFPENGRSRVVLTDNDLSSTLQFPDDPDGGAETKFGGVRRAKHVFARAQSRLSERGDRVGLAWPPRGMDFNDWLIQQVAVPESKAA